MAQGAGWHITIPISGEQPVPWMALSGESGAMAADGRSQHLWEHYLYNGDKKYLASVYPVLKGAAMFYADFLIEHPKYHWLVICPDMSPENAPQAHQGSSLDAGVTMTNQIVFDVFSYGD